MYLQTPNPRFEKIGILSCQAGDNDLSPIVIRYQSFKINMALDKIQNANLLTKNKQKKKCYIDDLPKPSGPSPKKNYKNSYSHKPKHTWVLPKIGVQYPQIIHFNKVFHYKPSILGYHYFWKHPHLVIPQVHPSPEVF